MSYTIFRFLLRVIYRLLFRLKAVGTEHIPAEGAVIIASNHISLLDPPAVGVLIKRKVHFMAKEELFKVPVFGPLIRSFGAYPVKRGGVSIDAIKSSINLLKSGMMVGIFPEGTRQKANDPDAAAGAKKGTAMIALRSNATVVPVAIVGNYKLFRRTTIVYGKPVDIKAVTAEEGKDIYEAVTEEIMRHINKLKASV
ncbi:1-acyl-sn-glycerol-3-phosphate acyltransferase [Paenibacillus montaniterrae]|uniref:1-acyl-sn-glycerol-3-phosphate acyltransferase n=1 Tax=Paenibacillus montaniterrae TaxID=429341 RepID=A0A919YKK5_9BACL|nr:lysophospholipid acyltransferase family protein [Paenibacillus montaniterrae]GIP15165.1 1-acyl-sn-glycerol-3-phosphate acyltransferase [Paenibacillus montaniterrae]